MPAMPSHAFQSEHSPRGCQGSFALGLPGAGGGFSIESGKIGEQDVLIGYHREGLITLLPYAKPAEGAPGSGMAEFIPTGEDAHGPARTVRMRVLDAAQVSREYDLATDRYAAEGVRFDLATPVWGIPDPDTATTEVLKDALAPAIVGRLTFDNSDADAPMTGFFAVGELGGFSFLADETGGELEGIHCLAGYGLAVRSAEGIRSFSDFDVPTVFDRVEPLRTRLGGTGGILVDVPAGQSRTVLIALGWHRAGVVTLGRPCSYYYTRWFPSLADVLSYALDRAEPWLIRAEADDEWLEASGLNRHQQFLLAKSVRSYWGNTQLFADGSGWRWVVNEGSCNMINTLDLTVDMAFWERRQHPWLLRNVLDVYADEFGYLDTVHAPDDPETPLPGGVSFTHDQDDRNVFAPRGMSHYELADHPGCFSFMTHEELLNWLLCAGLYVQASDDDAWLARRAGLISECLQSMQNRDHADPSQRDGLMSFDSDQCGSTSEITTYDSLDPSLGQARRNVYMGVKCWAGYLVAAWLLDRHDDALWAERIASARHSAKRAAETVAGAWSDELGYIPAILDGQDRSAIIPVIEALAYPAQMGMDDAVADDGPFAPMIDALRRHFEAVLRPGLCQFEDGGWKLSGNNDNSWMSKIFLCQYVARAVLGIDMGEESTRHDAAHDHWWRVGCSTHSVVDQVIAGRVGNRGSTYPRTVSGFLWLDELGVEMPMPV